MQIEELFESASVAHSLAFASPEELSALQDQLILKRDKLYIHCHVRQKEFLAKPEEIVSGGVSLAVKRDALGRLAY